MSGDETRGESRRTVLKKGAVGAGAVAGGLVATGGSGAALDTDDLSDLSGIVEIGDVEVDLEEVDVLSEGDGSDDELVTVRGRGEYAFVVFADDITLEHGNVSITVADTSISDSRAFYIEGTVDADSPVDAEQYVAFVVEGVEMIATDVLGTDVDVFLDADEEDA